MRKNPRTTGRAGSLQRVRVVKAIDTASGPLNSASVAFSKMFGPLTPAEWRELRAVTNKLMREAEKLLRLVATKPKKRHVPSKSSRKKRA